VQAHEAASGGDCTRSGKRVAAASMVPDDLPVGAVRVSANGWEAAVLEGLEVCLVAPTRCTLRWATAFAAGSAEITLRVTCTSFCTLAEDTQVAIVMTTERWGVWGLADVRHTEVWSLLPQPLIARRPPGVILVELHPRRMARAGGGTAAALLGRMCELGYCDISHSGAVCDERWLNITRTIRCACGRQHHDLNGTVRQFRLHAASTARGVYLWTSASRIHPWTVTRQHSQLCVGFELFGNTEGSRLMLACPRIPRRSTGAMGLAAQEALKQPTWCRLSPDKFPVLEARAHATAPENLLFTYKNHVAAAASTGSSAASQLRAAGTAGDTARAAAMGNDSSQPRTLISAAADAAVRGREAREVDPAPAAVPAQQAAGELGSPASLPESAGLTPGSGGPDSAAARR